jgi:hypothetical protein
MRKTNNKFSLSSFCHISYSPQQCTGLFKYLLCILPLSLISNSCKKFVEVGTPSDQVVTVTVFSDDATATSAILGLYHNIMDFNNSLLNGGATLCAGLSSDEIVNRSSNSEHDAFRNNSIQASSENLNNWLWSPSYINIYHANAIIAGLEQSSNLSPSVKQQLQGEAKFIRGITYFYLSNLFGDIPLILSTDFRINQHASRTSRDEVIQQIILDLKDAKNQLPEGYLVSERTRPNKWTAAALLSRVYLYRNEWKNAEDEASEVIMTSSYELASDLNKAFIINSREVIFQMAPVNSFNSTAEGLAFVPSGSATGRPSYLLTANLLSAFEVNDKRKAFWTNVKTVSSIDYFFAYKYKIRSSPTPSNECNIVLRLAEQYLIRAEARAQQDNVDGAQEDLNIIRRRAGLAETTATTKQDLLSTILHERQVELFAEWGHRWFDLIRTGKATAVLESQKSPNWQDTDTLFPIPISQLKLNPSLTQNPGY